MESVIHALLREGVSVDEFYSFVTENGIQEDPFIQEIFHQLLIEQVTLNPGSPRQWTTDDTDDLLELLKSPEKSSDRQNERALKEIHSNVLPGSSGGQIGAGKQTPFICVQCGKQFSQQYNLNQHMKGVHEKALLSCRKCGKTYTRNAKRLEHESKCQGSVAFSSGKCPEVLSGTPRQRTRDDDDYLLELSKFPKKSSDHQNKRALSEIDPNILSGTSGGQIGAGKQTPFICVQCGKQFSLQHNLNQHMKGVHEKTLLSCRKCGKTYTRNAKRLEHESKCRGSVAFPCDKCSEVLNTARQLEFHQTLKHKVKPTARKTTTTGSPQTGASTYNCRRCDAKFQNKKQLQANNARQHGGGPSAGGSNPKAGPSTYKCRRCPAQFPDRRALHAHTMERHYQVGAGLHPEPFAEGREPWIHEDGSIDEGLRDCYRTNRALILERYREGPVDSVYNIPIFPGMSMGDIGEALQGIYDRQRHSFKVNLSFGFIMRHVETGRHRYFRPYDNVNVFDAPILISRRSDIGKILKKLKALDIMAEMSKNRSDTKWRLVLLTNIRVKIFNTNFPLGAVKNAGLPVYITRNMSIVPLDKDPVTFHPYTDNLCLFRCLCLHRYGSMDKAKVLELYNQWEKLHNQREYQEFLGGRTSVQITPASQFKGFQLRDLPEFEQRFELNVYMYCLHEDGVVVPVFKSTDRYADTMYVNQYENHCSYVTQFGNYAKTFQCELCDRMFDDNWNFKRHAKLCDKKTEFEYPGGFYKEQRTVFDELAEISINVPQDDRTYPWFAVFDFESMLLKLKGDATEKLEWTHQHVSISVSVCSNVPFHKEPVCIVNAEQDELLNEMVDTLTRIQTAAATYAGEKWGQYLEKLKKYLDSLNEDGEECTKEVEKTKLLYGKLKAYMSTLPVLGFNSYGSMIMDKTKHRNVFYVEGENRACFEVNKPQFRQTMCLDEDDQYYEVEAAKQRIKLDLPVQLGFFILQYAKLRMLQFYYDLLDKYVDRSDFEYMEMGHGLCVHGYISVESPGGRKVRKAGGIPASTHGTVRR